MEEEEKKEEEPVIETNNEEPIQEAQESVENTTEEVKEESQEPVNEVPDAPPKKKKPIVLIIIIVILLLALIIGLIFLLKPSGKDNKENDNTEINTPSEVKSDYRMLSNALEKFDLFFLKLENKEENIVYSPLSIKYALQMLSEGSSGETKAQIDAVIGEYETKKYANNSNMSFANSMFIRDTFKDYVKDEYKQMLSEKYGAEVNLDAFSNPDNINKWISDKTFGLIKDLVSSVKDDDFFLINALAIDMNWVNQIHCSMGSDVPCKFYYVNYPHEKLEGEDYEYLRIKEHYTEGREYETIKFNGKDNVKGASLIASFNRYDIVKTLGYDKIKEIVGKAYKEYRNYDDTTPEIEQEVDKVVNDFINDLEGNNGKADYSTDFSYYIDDNVKVFAKDLQTYGDTTLQYVGIMPIKDSLSDYISNVSVKDINQLINSVKDMRIENFKEGYVTIIEGNIPLFNYEYELKLKEDLAKLGITDVFDFDKADLSGMVKDTPDPVAVFDAKHKANIDFSNDGIRAAAATTIGGGLGNAGDFNYLFEVPTIRIDISFDKPYMYLIRDKITGEVWFVGTVYEPSTNK